MDQILLKALKKQIRRKHGVELNCTKSLSNLTAEMTIVTWVLFSVFSSSPLPLQKNTYSLYFRWATKPEIILSQFLSHAGFHIGFKNCKSECQIDQFLNIKWLCGTKWAVKSNPEEGSSGIQLGITHWKMHPVLQYAMQDFKSEAQASEGKLSLRS